MSYLDNILGHANAVGDAGGDALGAFIQGNANNWGINIDPSFSVWGAPSGDTGPSGLLNSGSFAPVSDQSFSADSQHASNLENVMGTVTDMFGKVSGALDSTFGSGTSKMLLAASLQAYGQDKQNKSAAKQREKELELSQKYKLDQMDKAHEQAQIRFPGDRRDHKEFK